MEAAAPKADRPHQGFALPGGTLDLPALSGLLRSLAIYYGRPLRARRMRAFYRQMVRPGDLVFDVGAHVGSRARAFHALGARVVAIEPQPLFAGLLRTILPRERMTLLACALAAHEGETELLVSRRHPTVSTVSPDFAKGLDGAAGFDHVRWDRRVRVPVTTLDRLIETYGMPAFVKIDAEGFEADILAGLSQPVPLLSFEYLPALPAITDACLARLETFGRYRFNAVTGEAQAFLWPDWASPAELRRRLPGLRASGRSGDL
ncbi:FkbM family methyltransferase [Propylenella binzhouense]|uniref:FkbM family methyltransferase n=1 Tax=Propylenella binzhouense TaxID=2555902 RepID=A0A964WVL7_9HYPH|nr:FkbM family methyltransferase [Propylenella binzhouense]MYZ50316.1 FkbM family methyltransferase [Propylenella binzhouense]